MDQRGFATREALVLGQVMISRKLIQIGLLGFFLSSCACGREAPAWNPRFDLVGESVQIDPSTDGFVVDFGQMITGETYSLEVFIANLGIGDLIVTAGDNDDVDSEVSVGFQTLIVPGGKQKKADFSLLSFREGRVDVLLHLKTNEGPTGTRPVRFRGVAHPSLDCTPSEVDFGFVPPGEEFTKWVECTNRRSTTLIASIYPHSSEIGFTSSFQPGDSQIVQVDAGEKISLRISFSRSGFDGFLSSDLLIIDQESQILAAIPLLAGGQEPFTLWENEKDRLNPRPGCFLIPETFVGQSKRATLYLENQTWEEILVSGLSFLGDDSPFAARFPVAPFILEPRDPDLLREDQEALKVEIQFQPKRTGWHLDHLVIQTGEKDDVREARFCFEGYAPKVEPCVFNLEPRVLDFGVVHPGFDRSLTAYLTNTQETDCFITDVHLSPGSDPAFALKPIEKGVIAGGERLPIRVTFYPDGESDSLRGNVNLSVSSITEPTPSIYLRGVSRRGCLDFDPSEIDFGATGIDCPSRRLQVRVSNICDQDVAILGISVDDAYPEFHLDSLPRLPILLPPAGSLGFQASILPSPAGSFHGAIRVEVEEASGIEGQTIRGAHLVEMKGASIGISQHTDSFFAIRHHSVDVLFVVDNTLDASPLQGLLENGAEPFLREAHETYRVDANLGVTTSGLLGSQGEGCPGGFGGEEDGRLFPHPSLGRLRILSSSMQEGLLLPLFQQNIQVGTCKESSAPLEAARRALSPPWIDTPLWEGGNQGFLRPWAALSIIGVSSGSDADSFWEGEPAEDRSVDKYVSFFRSLKQEGMQDLVRVHFISGPRSGDCPSGAAEPCPRCVEGAAITGGAWLDACTSPTDPSWESRFLELARAAIQFYEPFTLREVPDDWNGDGKVDPFDIEVRVGGIPIPHVADTGRPNWEYDAIRNTVVFSSTGFEFQSQEVEVTYLPACRTFDG